MDAVAADDRLVIRALLRHVTTIAVSRWKDAAAVIEDLVAEGFREAEADLGAKPRTDQPSPLWSKCRAGSLSRLTPGLRMFR